MLLEKGCQHMVATNLPCIKKRQCLQSTIKQSTNEQGMCLVLCVEGYPVCCRMLHRESGFYSPEASPSHTH